ncbi:cation efflux protein [Lipomyces oligophaga]|uniref:cation efflux protein n=1 Tax=Lipomyces oligophaga TaxID=45792 RepID=UPI0034CEFF04
MAGLGKQGRITALLVLDSVFFLLEVIVGYAVHSLALVADSFHMLNDVFSLIIALWAVKVTKTRPASAEYSYGWQRAEILGALVNGVFLLALCLTIFLEALQRFFEPQTITNPVLVLVVGCAGLLSNFIGLLLFHEHGGHSHSHGGGHSHGGHTGHEHTTDSSTVESMDIEDLLPDVVVQDSIEQQRQSQHRHAASSEYQASIDSDEHSPLLSETPSSAHSHSHGHGAKSKKSSSSQSLNMRGVFLHVMGDALGNVGVIATAIFIWKTDYTWRFYFDPVVSLVITCIIFASALPLVKSASKILLQAAPTNIDTDHVRDEILHIEGIKSVHDFHVWCLRENLFIASLHVALVSGSVSDFNVVAKRVRKCLHAYGIHSATIQPEFQGFPLSTASSEVSLPSNTTLTGGATGTSTGTATPSTTQQLTNSDKSCLCVEGCGELNCCASSDDHPLNTRGDDHQDH